MLLGFREGAVGHGDAPGLHAQGGGALHRLQGVGRQVVAAGGELLGVVQAFAGDGLVVGIGQAGQLGFVEIDQAEVFHDGFLGWRSGY
ncbi:hypothetical protein D3C85_1425730 [compost metagenome]